MKYGKDYGVKVEVPWYIKCPIVNFFFNTCKIHLTLTTFSESGAPVLGVSGTFRIPFKDKENFINSVMRVRYCFPNDEMDFGYGIYAGIKLIDINHRKMYDLTDERIGLHCLSIGYEAKPSNLMIWFGSWRNDLIDVTFRKKDYGRK